MLIEAVVTLVLVYLVHFFITTFMMRRKMPPGPFPYPLLGNFPHLLCDPINPYDKLADKYGDIFTLFFPNGDKTVILNTASLVREARLGTADSLLGKAPSHIYPWNEIFKVDMMTANYSPEWLFQRRVFKSAMHVYGAGVEKASELAGHAVDIVIKEINSKRGTPFSPIELLRSAVIIQLWEWLTSEKIGLDDPIIKKLVLFDAIVEKQAIISTMYQVVPFLKYLPSEANREMKEAQRIRQTIFPKAFISHKLTYTSGIIRDLIDGFISCYEKEIAKETNQRIGSIDDIPGLIADVAFAGSGSTSTAITWLWLYLVLNPDVQTKIQKELDEVVGSNCSPSWKDVRNMPYMQATLCEVQRASGMLVLYGNTAARDVTISGYNVPKGTFVAFHLNKVHHDPREWPEPEKFKPERFLDANGKFVGWTKLHGFIPFGVGKRDCPGQAFAKIMMFTFASVLLHNYKLELPEGADIPSTQQDQPALLKRPKEYKIIAKKRKV